MTKIGYAVLKEMTYKGHSIKVVDRLNQELVYINNNEEETFFSVADAKRAYMRLSSTEYEEEAQRCSCYCNEQAVAYLENALCKAQKAAYAVENTPDGGASNFDEVILVTSVKKYDLHAMDINLELVAKDTYLVDFNLNGQGERRSAMAQAACKSLQKSGYKAYVKYILD